MTFVVVFVGLMVERFFDWSHLRNWSWFANFQRWVMNQFRQPSAYVNLAMSIVPVLLLVWLINRIFHGWMYGFPSLVFKILVFLYVCGPKNLWADAFARMNLGSNQDLVSNIFIGANRRVFAIVFWFVLLGPVGAVFYRLIAVSANEPALSPSAQTVESVLDWVPVRILTAFFALGGQFMQVLKVWRQKAVLGLFSNDDMMVECGMAALGAEDARAAVSLIDRSLGMVLIVLALVMLV